MSRIREMVKVIQNKVALIISSLLFRIKHSIFRGKIRSDLLAINQCRFGRSVIVSGSIYVTDSIVILGNYSAVASTAEIGAEKKGIINIQDRVVIGARCLISTTSGAINIGEGTSFFSDCRISGAVTIGVGCLFGSNVTILSSTHAIYGEGSIRDNDAALFAKNGRTMYNPVVIEDDCWLGSNSVVLPGVHLRKGTVVGANAVVTKTFPDYSIIGGVPAREMGSRKNPLKPSDKLESV